MSTSGSLCRDKFEHADIHATLPNVNDEHLKRTRMAAGWELDSLQVPVTVQVPVTIEDR
jgi:hypothetical protein